MCVCVFRLVHKDTPTVHAPRFGCEACVCAEGRVAGHVVMGVKGHKWMCEGEGEGLLSQHLSRAGPGEGLCGGGA